MSHFELNIGRFGLASNASTDTIHAQQGTSDTVVGPSSSLTTTVVVTGNVSANPSPRPVISSADGPLAFSIVLVLCILAGALFGGLLFYVATIQNAFYAALKALVAKGKTPLPDNSSGPLAQMKSLSTQDSFEIAGEAKISVGEAAEFKVIKTDSAGKKSEEPGVTFKVDPADMAAVNSKSATVALLIAARPVHSPFRPRPAQTSMCRANRSPLSPPI